MRKIASYLSLALLLLSSGARATEVEVLKSRLRAYSADAQLDVASELADKPDQEALLTSLSGDVASLSRIVLEDVQKIEDQRAYSIDRFAYIKAKAWAARVLIRLHTRGMSVPFSLHQLTNLYVHYTLTSDTFFTEGLELSLIELVPQLEIDNKALLEKLDYLSWTGRANVRVAAQSQAVRILENASTLLDGYRHLQPTLLCHSIAKLVYSDDPEIQRHAMWLLKRMLPTIKELKLTDNPTIAGAVYLYAHSKNLVASSEALCSKLLLP